MENEGVNFEVLARKFRNLENLQRYGVNNGKLNKRLEKKTSNRDLYVVLNLDKRGNVLHVPGFDDEGEAPQQEQGAFETA